MADVSWILLIEDEADHRVLIREALSRIAGGVPVHEAVDGAQAIRWLADRAAGPDAMDGGLVVVDLGLPKISGFGVLEWMRESPALDGVSAVVLTASENPMDAEHAFNLGAKGYFQKPTDFREYVEIFERVFESTGPSDDGEDGP